MSPVERKILLNPGPATTTDTVKQALVIPDICPREEEFTSVMAEVRERLCRIAGDPEEITCIPVVGSGTTALEAMLTSFVPDDGEVIFVDNGDYGTRMARMAATHGMAHHVVECGWGQPVDVASVEAAIDAHSDTATHLVFVHHETSSGMLNPLPELAEMAHRHGLTVMVDAVSSFAALPLRVAPGGGDAVDVLVSSSNKCVQGMAGLGFAIATLEALSDARRSPARTFTLDLVAEYDHLEKTGQTRFTFPPQVVSALRQALLELEAEGLEGRGERYANSMRALRAGLAELGFDTFLEDRHQSGILVSIREPDADWFDFDRLHDALYAQGITIYPGKVGADPMFRLAVLGAIDVSDIEVFLAALRKYVESVS